MIKYVILILFTLHLLPLSAQRVEPIIIGQNQKVKSPKTGSLAAVGSLIWSEDFEATGNSFPYNSITSTSKSTVGFERGDSSYSNQGSVFVVPSTGRFAFTNDDACNCDKSEDELILPVMAFNAANGAILRFDAYFNRSYQFENVKVFVEQGINWKQIAELASSGHWQAYEILISGSGINNPRIKFVYDDDSAWASGFAIDNIEVYHPSTSLDLRMDSILINEMMDFEFYKEIPKNQASAYQLSVRSTASNISTQNTTGAGIRTEITGQMTQRGTYDHGALNTLDTMNGVPLGIFSLSNGRGEYTIASRLFSDSLDGDSSNDTLAMSVDVTDTVYSRVDGNKAEQGFWYGPGLDYGIFSLIDVSSKDTASSISIYLHENTQVGDSIDVLLLSEFLQDVVKDTFPQINERIVLKPEHIGKWVTIKIPRSPIVQGKYYVGVRTRGQRVVMGVNDRPVQNDLAIASYGQGYGSVDFLPYVKLNVIGNSCTGLNVTESTIKPNCSVNNGQIVLTTSGGQPPYRYQWGANGGYSTQRAINAIRSGVYRVSVTDTNGCAAVKSIALSDTSAMQVNVDSLRNEQCFGDRAGYIDLSASGGQAPYQFVWQDGFVGSTRTSMIAGSYNAVVSDASSSGCVSLINVEVTGPREALSTTAIINHNLCFKDTSGSIEVLARGGFGAYNYQWNPGGSMAASRYHLRTGRYHVTVSDGNLCTTVDSMDVLGADSLGVSGQVYDTSGTASIFTAVVGGVAPYTYNWNGPIGSGFINPGTPDLFGLIDRGIYRLEVIDSLGCSQRTAFNVSGNVSVEEHHTLQARVAPNPNQGEFRIINADEAQEVRIFDFRGKLMMNLTNYQGEPIQLPVGIYMLHVGSSMQTTKILKVIVTQ